MTLTSAIDGYLTLKRSLGAGCRRRNRFCGPLVGPWAISRSTPFPLRRVPPFAAARVRPPASGRIKHQTLRGFFNYLVSRGYLAASPLQEPGPRAARSFQPYIYSHEELQRLLQATAPDLHTIPLAAT